MTLFYLKKGPLGGQHLNLILKSFPDRKDITAGYMSLDDNIVNFNVHHVYTGFPKGSGSNFHDVTCPLKVVQVEC